jgi:hypothetical protein
MGIWDGEKPRVMMVRLCATGSDTLSKGTDSGEVFSEVSHGDFVLLELDCSGTGGLAMLSSTDGERGKMGRGAFSGSLASTIERTIFSNSSEVMWRSRPRLRLLAHESCLCIVGRTMSIGADSVVKSRASSSATESTLPES